MIENKNTPKEPDWKHFLRITFILMILLNQDTGLGPGWGTEHNLHPDNIVQNLDATLKP